MRGLESLIPQKKNPYEEERAAKESVFMIDISKIKPNPYQPRREFKEEELQSLADSIKVYGILQPLIVSKVEHDVPSGRQVEYELIAGERRLRAAHLANIPQVPVIVRHAVSNTQKLEVALIENLQRDDLNAIEEARAYKQLQEEFGMSQAEIGRRLSKSRPYIANTVRILGLPEHIQQALMRGEINEGHTRPLLSLTSDAVAQQKLFDQIVKQRFTVRDAEARSRELIEERNVTRAAGLVSGGKSVVDADLRALTERFKDHFQLPHVNVKAEGRQARLAVLFSNKKELVDWIEKLIS
jgi:ParB family transcriptional regulator, chromosome partitioning protein